MINFIFNKWEKLIFENKFTSIIINIPLLGLARLITKLLLILLKLFELLIQNLIAIVLFLHNLMQLQIRFGKETCSAVILLLIFLIQFHPILCVNRSSNFIHDLKSVPILVVFNNPLWVTCVRNILLGLFIA